MSEQLWTVTHATPEGQLRWWTVDDECATQLAGLLQMEGHENGMRLYVPTTACRVMIWLTPGQSLTVEKAR